MNTFWIKFQKFYMKITAKILIIFLTLLGISTVFIKRALKDALSEFDLGFNDEEDDMI